MDREELINEKHEEYKRDDMIEKQMEKDYDFFLSTCEDEIEEFSKLYYELRTKFEAYDWDFELDDILI